MELKKILILKRERLNVDNKIFKQIEDIFSDSNVVHKNFSEINKKDVSDVDLVITIGGDGTFIKAANMIDDAHIIGINSNPDKSEGAIIDLTLEDIPKLAKIKTGDFGVCNRQRISTYLNGKELSEKAINEVYIGSESAFFTSRYVINFNGSQEEHRSSGLIVATGTGSTAWYASAGGKPFDFSKKELRFIVREPYFGKKLFKPKILNGKIDENDKLRIISKNDHREVVAINDSFYGFERGSYVDVKLSSKPLKCIVLN